MQVESLQIEKIQVSIKRRVPCGGIIKIHYDHFVGTRTDFGFRIKTMRLNPESGGHEPWVDGNLVSFSEFEHLTENVVWKATTKLSFPLSFPEGGLPGLIDFPSDFIDQITQYKMWISTWLGDRIQILVLADSSIQPNQEFSGAPRIAMPDFKRVLLVEMTLDQVKYPGMRSPRVYTPFSDQAFECALSDREVLGNSGVDLDGKPMTCILSHNVLNKFPWVQFQHDVFEAHFTQVKLRASYLKPPTYFGGIWF